MIVIRGDDGGVHELGGGRSTLHTLQSISTEQCRTPLTKPVPLDSKHLPVAGVAVDLAVGSITRGPGVKIPGTPTTFETLLVPHLAFGEDLEISP